MAQEATVRYVICEFRDGADPLVTVKYDVVDPDRPALGTSRAQAALTDPAPLAAITALAESLVPATSALLGIPLSLPPGPSPEPTM